MTFSELRKKDVICLGDGRVLGRISDLEFDSSSGHIRALCVPCGSCFSSIWHGDKNLMVIPWGQVACIGDDVILVSQTSC